MAAKTKHEFVLIGKDKASKVISGVSKTTMGFLDTTHKLTSVMSNSMNIIGGVTRSMKALGGAMAVPIKLAAEQARVEAQLGAVLESTGHAAGLNADQLKKMASEMQQTTQFGDEAVIGMQNLLLTFTNIGGSGGIFERTSKVALDVSTAMGMDLKSSALQLGKALNDPATGLSMLTRVGITFSEEQKEVIKQLQKTGDMAGAQTVILDELERQFGGSAETMRGTFAGSIEAAKNVFGDFQEAIGRAIIENPQLQAVIRLVTNAMGDFANQVATGTGPLGFLGEMMSGMVSSVIPAMIDAVAYVADTFAGNTGLSVALDVVGALFTAVKLAVENAVTQFQILWRVLKLVAAVATLNGDEINKLKGEIVDLTIEAKDRTIEAWESVREEFNDGSEAAGDLAEKLRGMAAEVRSATDVAPPAAAAVGDFKIQLTELDEAASSAADSVADVNDQMAVTAGVDLAELNRSTFKYLDALKRDLPDVSRDWTKMYLDLKDNIEDLPLAEQEAELQKFHDALQNMFDRAVGGSAEQIAAMNQVAKSAKDASAEVEKATKPATGVPGGAAPGGAGIGGGVGDLVPDVKRAEAEWEQSAEAMGNSLGDSLSGAFEGAMTGQATLFEGFQRLNENMKSSMAQALLDPIMGAQSPMAELFSMALSPIAMVGEAIAENLFRPLVDGMKNYFSQKATNAATDAATMQSLDTATNATAQANAAATGSSMAASMAPAASLSSIASFGAALAFGFLVTTVAMKVMDSFVGFAEGGFIDKDQVVRVGEGNKPEVIIPLTKPDRAKALLAETFSRHPELFLSALGGRQSSQSTATAATNNFSITVNGAADPNQTSMAVVSKIDQMLGRRINARI